MLLQLSDKSNDSEVPNNIKTNEDGGNTSFAIQEDEIEIEVDTDTDASIEELGDSSKLAPLSNQDSDKVDTNKPINQVKKSNSMVKPTKPARNKNINNKLENSPFTDNFKLIPTFGLSNNGPRAQIQSMMIRILQQDPQIFKNSEPNVSRTLPRSGRQFEGFTHSNSNPAVKQFKIPENFRTYLRRSPQWVNTSYW